jgi:chromosomal replication initiator protein
MKVSSQELLTIYMQMKSSFQKLHEVIEQEDLSISPIIFNADPKKVTARSIIDLVNMEFELDIRTKSRQQSIVIARQIACYLIRKFTNLSYSEIAAHIGLSDHTTIMYSVKKCQELMDLELVYKEKVEKLSNELQEYLLNLS